MTTPNFQLPEWEQDQDQPHVTVDTALRIIDCLAQLVIQDRDLASPPSGSAAASDGECYILSGAGSGAWASASEGDVAMFIGTGWIFRTPHVGWRAYVADEAVDVRFLGGSTGWDVVA
jgi:hypothetical protein